MQEHDAFNIDSHKLHLHPKQVAEWQEGKLIPPIYVEVSPSGACNHRCRFCALDYLGYKPRFLPAEAFAAKLAELGPLGVKSIMFAGEGEPLLHRDIPLFAETAKQAGIDIAFTTNAVLLHKHLSHQILQHTSWIKVSCNAGSPDSYAKIHQTSASDFDQVMKNMEEAVEYKKSSGLSCTLGFQMILLPENMDEAEALARRVRDIGADYLVIKPFSSHNKMLRNAYSDLSYDTASDLAERLQACSTDSFKVIFRHNAMLRKANAKPPYNRCLALPFWAYIDSGGGVWGCCRHIGDQKFYFGNILAQSAADIFSGEVRENSIHDCQTSFNVAGCYLNCRMDPINRYLWGLKNPHPHVNFI